MQQDFQWWCVFCDRHVEHCRKFEWEDHKMWICKPCLKDSIDFTLHVVWCVLFFIFSVSFFCRIIGETFASWKSIMIIWFIVKTFPNFCPFAGSENIISNIMVCSTSLCMFFFQSSADLEFKRGMCRHDLQSSFCQIKWGILFESLDQWPH